VLDDLSCAAPAGRGTKSGTKIKTESRERPL
jgi:hypothetical protein